MINTLKKLNKEEILICLEIANEALKDDETFDTMAERLDINDRFLVDLNYKLDKYLNKEVLID